MKLLCLLLSILFFACSTGVPVVEQRMLARKLIDQGVLHLRSGNLAEARAVFLMAGEIEQNAQFYDALGSLAFAEQKYLAAEKYFILAYQQDNDYFNALGNLAVLYDILGERKLADELYQQVIKKDPKNFKFRNNFAVFLYDYYSKRGQSSDLAKEEFLKAKNLFPADTIVKNLGMIK